MTTTKRKKMNKIQLRELIYSEVCSNETFNSVSWRDTSRITKEVVDVIRHQYAGNLRAAFAAYEADPDTRIWVSTIIRQNLKTAL